MSITIELFALNYRNVGMLQGEGWHGHGEGSCGKS